MSSVTDTNSTRRLEDKTAVIFGVGGEVGGAVAQELAAQGACLFLSGRTKAPVQELVRAISSRGQTAAAAEVDVLDEDAVNSQAEDGRDHHLQNAAAAVPTLAETAKLVIFVASEEASTLTGAIINSSSGLVLDS